MILKRFSLAKFYGDRRSARVIDFLLLFLLATLIVSAPLPFGSVEPCSVFGIQLVAAVCFLLWIVKLVFCPDSAQLADFQTFHRQETEAYGRAPFFEKHPVLAAIFKVLTLGRYPHRFTADNIEMDMSASRVRRTFFAVAGFPIRNTGLEIPALILLCLLVVQLLPWPHGVSRILSPQSAQLYSTAAAIGGESISKHPLSVDGFSTFSKFLEYVGYFMIYLVLANASPAQKYFKVIVHAMVASALFQAAYGMAEYLSGHQHIFGYEKRVNDDVATGTFINRNHYASYLEMSLPLVLAMLAGMFGRNSRSRSNLAQRISEAAARNGGKILLLLFVVALILSAIVSSLSRSGILFTGVTCCAFLVLFSMSQRKISASMVAILALGLIALVAVGILWQPLFARFAKITTEFTADRARLFLYRDTLKVFADFPLIGSGAGTFMQIFPRYKGFVTHDTYRYAHNDYLQLFAEIGFSGVILLAVLLYLIVKRILRIFQLNGPKQLLHLAAFCALLSVALHSLTDFGVHIPAIAVNAVVVSALFWRTPGGDQRII